MEVINPEGLESICAGAAVPNCPCVCSLGSASADTLGDAYGCACNCLYGDPNSNANWLSADHHSIPDPQR